MEMISLSRETAEEIQQSIRSLMCQWSPYDNGSDYACAFCGARADSNLSLSIRHMSDCQGMKMCEEIKQALK